MLQTSTRPGSHGARPRGPDGPASGAPRTTARTRILEDQLRLRNAAGFADAGGAMAAAIESRAVRILLGAAFALALLSVLIGAVIVYANLGETEAEVAARMRGVEFIVGGLTMILVLGFYAVSQVIGFVSALVGVVGGVVVPAVWIGLVSQGSFSPDPAPAAAPPLAQAPPAQPTPPASTPRPPPAGTRPPLPLVPDFAIEPEPPAPARPAAAPTPAPLALPAPPAETLAPAPPAPAAPAPGVERIQLALRARGHDPGTIDGVLGIRTQAAIRAFQRVRNEPATGELTAAQLQALLAPGGAGGD